jgi:hypothetical protein
MVQAQQIQFKFTLKTVLILHMQMMVVYGEEEIISLSMQITVVLAIVIVCLICKTLMKYSALKL